MVDDVKYSNFMEEVAVRVSQSLQPLSGSVAELCAILELERHGLKKGTHFTYREKPTDITVYHPALEGKEAIHRIEVKNVKMKERAARGLLFDGDSLFGFFNAVKEYSASKVKELDEQCLKTSGYCYLPPATLDGIKHPHARFRPNTQFGKDMATYSLTGKIP